MLQLAFRSFFFIAVILAYSTGIWRLINDYFRHEFQSYLKQEAQTNKYLLQNPPDGVKVAVLAGRPFTGGGTTTEGAENGPPKAGAAHRTVTDSISVFANLIAGGTDFLPSPVAAGKGQEGEKQPGKMATEAAEVTDIRHPGQREEEGTGQEAEEDKWIAYWQQRKGKDGNGGAEANAFCSVGLNPSESLLEDTEECGERLSAEDL
ncbi:uncharacterized protein LOC131290665 [Anopheles ziemanni]|uniref:uncharacterized protein LOC131268848 n=1 Tax=Anopheles coustani TaxID=139045 RepID=UPI00265B3689|nr:uncharacterized protein LOC131268848 [Anopheles coustani]XP_058175812.1 uncharacterized protein LOC131290665 [Anopheles ziemanni]